MVKSVRALAVLAAALIALAIAGTASAQKYIVVLKTGHSARDVDAIRTAGGTVLRVNKLGIATASSSKPSFARTLRRSGAVAGVARDARFGTKTAKAPSRFTARAAVHSIATEQAACS